MIVEIDGQRFDVPDDATPDEIDQITRPAAPAPTPSLGARLMSGVKEVGRYGYGQAEAAANLGLQGVAYGPGAAAAAGQYSRVMYAPWDNTKRQLEMMIPPVGHPASPYKTEAERNQALARMLQQEAISQAGEARQQVTSLLAPGPQTAEGQEVVDRFNKSAPMRALAWTGEKGGDAAAWLNAQMGGSPEDQEVIRSVYGEAIPILAMHGIGKTAGIAREKLAPWLKEQAERSAVRSAGADRTALKRTFGRPLDDAALRETGRYLLDSKIPLRSPAAMVEGLENVLAKEGPEIGATVRRASQAGAKVDVGAVSAKVLKDLDYLKTNTETRPIYERVKRFLDDQATQHPQGMDPMAAHGLRQTLDTLSKWERGQPQIDYTAAEAFRKVRGALSDELGASIDRVGLGNDWKAANYEYRNAATAKKLADVGKERRGGNAPVSLPEKIAAGTGGAVALAAHNPAALVPAAAGIALHRWGFPVTATVSDALSKALERPATVRPPLAAPVPNPYVAALVAALRDKPATPAPPWSLPFGPNSAAADDNR